jgi:hypothetical protein
MALTALTTEHFNLQTARRGTISEANGRSTLDLGTLSSAVIAIAFVGQADEFGDVCYLFALVLLPPVFLLGVFSYLRLPPAPGPRGGAVLPADRPRRDQEARAHGGRVDRPLQTLLTAASMIACINAIASGVTRARAVRRGGRQPARMVARTGTADRDFS